MTEPTDPREREDGLPIGVNTLQQYIVAKEGDCVYLTFVGKRHTTVQHRLAGTLTTRPGELGVVVEKK